MRRPAPLATVASVPSDNPAPVPARAPGLYAARRGRFGLAGLALLASLAAWVLSIRVPDHGPKVALSVLAVLAVLAMLAWAPACACHNSYRASDLGLYPRHSCSSASPT
jgi:cyanate permease